MSVVAISKDLPEISRDFARRAGIWFPLISDEDLEISKKWVGVSTDGYATPGTFLLSRGGEIALRKVGTRKDDRIYAAELIERIDALEQTDPASRVSLRGGFSPVNRAQFRLAVGGEGAADRNVRPGGSLSIEALAPLARNLLVGGSSTISVAESSALDVGAHLRLRIPLYADLIETSLDIPIGPSIQLGDIGEANRIGLQAGGRLGFHFAIWPSLAVFLDTGLIYRQFFVPDAGDVRSFRLTTRAGVSWMP